MFSQINQAPYISKEGIYRHLKQYFNYIVFSVRHAVFCCVHLRGR